MSELDMRALEDNFAGWKSDRAPNLKESAAFERYSIEQILKDADLSDDEIQSGNFGGADDGGVDAMYLFVNRKLVQDETELPEQVLDVQLVIVQAKMEKGFSETAIEKLSTFTRDLLNFSRPVADMTYLNSVAKDAITRFRTKYGFILGSPHTLKIEFHYSIKGDTDPNTKVVARVDELKKYVKQQLSAANVLFEYWDCKKLLAAARSFPTDTFVLEITKYFATDDDAAVVCVSTLKSFKGFLTDQNGHIRRSILEPNVRDYQGKGNQVNKAIKATLENIQSPTEFWWLNNGITILASNYALTGSRHLSITRPEIVNGLQTSQEIFAYFQKNPTQNDIRNVLIRVIVPKEEQTRNKITRATNNQTPVPPVSLHATEDIHFDIEDKMKLYSLFYDRKKGQYRNQRKPISQIVSILSLSKAVIAMLLRRPNDARGRPQTLLNKDDTYKEIFNDTYDRDLYVVCILLDRFVEQYLDSRTDLGSDAARDIKYYVDMWVVSQLTQSASPSVKEIVSLKSQIGELDKKTDMIKKACDIIHEEYMRLGGNDKVSKGTEIKDFVVAQLNSTFPEKDAA